MKHVIVYSHGFGVRHDDRGLFTDIATYFPKTVSVTFDYNDVDEVTNTLTVAPLPEQAKKLRSVIAHVRASYHDAAIDLIGHSQGCVTAALAKSDGIRKTIFLAPPVDFNDTERIVREMCTQQNVSFSKEAAVTLQRKDGSTTVIPSEFWRITPVPDPQTLYDDLAKQTDLTIIKAIQDEILSDNIFDRLTSKVTLVELAANHNFEGKSREKLGDVLAKFLNPGVL